MSLLKKKNKGMYNAKVKLPSYLSKNSFTTLVIGFVRLNEDTLIIPYSNSFKKNHKNRNSSWNPINNVFYFKHSFTNKY